MFKKGDFWRHFSAAILREYFASRIFAILKYFYSKYALCVPTVTYNDVLSIW